MFKAVGRCLNGRFNVHYCLNTAACAFLRCGFSSLLLQKTTSKRLYNVKQYAWYFQTQMKVNSSFISQRIVQKCLVRLGTFVFLSNYFNFSRHSARFPKKTGTSHWARYTSVTGCAENLCSKWEVRFSWLSIMAFSRSIYIFRWLIYVQSEVLWLLSNWNILLH